MNLIILDNGDGTINVIFEGATYTGDFSLDFISTEVEENIRWYMEDYPSFPFGANLRRASLVEKEMLATGALMFASLFPEAIVADISKRITQHLKLLQIEVISNSMIFLSAPWELINADGENFIVPHCIGLSRKSGTLQNKAMSKETQSNTRILLVISRPASDEIPVATVALPMIDALSGSEELMNIELELLRPPTFEQFVEKVNSPPYYDIIHFDGHGLIKHSGDAGMATGYLIFEDKDQGVSVISGKELVNALPERSMIFILNACYSAKETRGQQSTSIAGNLVGGKIGAVIAMPFAVSVSTVRNFFFNFYKNLFRGASILHAFTDTQLALWEFHQEKRTSTPDWVIPRLFLAGEDFSIVHSKKKSNYQRESFKTQRGIFLRDKELLSLDRLLSRSDHAFVTLSGIIGEGKTFFVKHFAQWYFRTRGCKRTLYTDCSSNSGNIKIDFSSQTDTLFILDQADQFVLPVDLSLMESALSAKNNKVILVARTAYLEFPTLPGIVLGDLPNAAVAEAVNDIAGQRRDFLDDPFLMADFLLPIGYHGAALKEMLTLARTWDIYQLMKEADYGFLHSSPLFHIQEVEKTFASLPAATQRYLPVLSFFSKRFCAYTVSFFTNGEFGKNFFTELYGTLLTMEDWQKFMSSLAQSGLARNDRDMLFEIPLNVHYYLRRRLYEDLKDVDLIKRLKKDYVSLYGYLSRVGAQQTTENGEGMELLYSLEESNMESAVHHAIELESWENAISILQYLILHFLHRMGETHLANRLLKKYTRWIAGAVHSNGWMKFSTALIREQVTVLLDEHKFEEGRELLNALLSELKANYLPNLLYEYTLVTADLINVLLELRKPREAQQILEEAQKFIPKDNVEAHQILNRRTGSLHLENHRYNEAYAYYLEEVQRSKDSGDLMGLCTDYHQLGLICERQHLFDEARGWYLKALRQRELAGFYRFAHTDKFNLGALAEAQGQYEEAIKWFTDAFKDRYKFRQHLSAAIAAYRIGMACEQLNRFEDAEEWLRFALPIFKHFNDDMQQGHIYHELSIISLGQEKYTEAFEHSEKAFRFYSLCDDTEYQAGSKMQTGLVYLKQGDYSNARKELLIASELYQSLNYPPKLIVVSLNLASVELRLDHEKACVQYIQKAYFISAGNKHQQFNPICDCIDFAVKSMGAKKFLSFWNADLPLSNKVSSIKMLINPGKEPL